MKNERGHALFLVILTIVFISVVGMGLLTVTANSNKTTVHERQNQSLYYVAEAGINITKSNVLEQLNQLVDESLIELNNLPLAQKNQSKAITILEDKIKGLFCLDTQCNKYVDIHNHYSKQNGKQPVASVEALLSCNDDAAKKNCDILLKSKGYIVSEASNYRVLEQKLSIDLNKMLSINSKEGNTVTNNPNLPDLATLIRDFAVFSTGNVSIEWDSEIDGKVGSTLGKSAVQVPANFQNRDAVIVDMSGYYGIDLNQFLPEFPHQLMNKATNPNAFPDFGNVYKQMTNPKFVIDTTKDLDLSKSPYHFIQNLTLKKDLKVDVGNQNVFLVVDHFNVEDAKSLEIVGSGTLNIIIRDSFNLEYKLNKGKNAKISQLNVYYESTKPLVFNDITAEINGNLYVRNSNVQILRSLEVNGDYYQKHGSLSMENPSKMNRDVYLDDVVVTLKELAEIKGNFVVNNGSVLIKGTVDIEGNMYVNNANVTIEGFADIEKDFYMLEGNLLISGRADVDGNIYYAGTSDVVMNGKSDAKKGKLVVVPNAKFIGTEKTDIKGTIIAKEVIGQIKADFKYKDPEDLADYLRGKPIILEGNVEFANGNDYLMESPLIEK
jgi:hypothetical protein